MHTIATPILGTVASSAASIPAIVAMVALSIASVGGGIVLIALAGRGRSAPAA